MKLTHLPLNKMAAILADNIFNGIFLNENDWIPIKILLKYVPSGTFYLHGLTLIPAWISNYIHYKLWGEITYPFLNFNGCTIEV